MLKSTFQKLPYRHKVLISFLLAFTFILILLPSEPASASKQTTVNADDLVLGQIYPLPLHLENLADDDLLDETNKPDWKTYSVHKGDNLAKIFDRAGLTPQEVYAVSHAGNDAKKLLKMMPGDELSILVNKQGKFRSLNFRFSPTESLNISYNDKNQLQTQVDKKQIESVLSFTNGDIESSFWNAGIKAGMTEKQIMSLANIFGWDIDFALELRAGDSFSVIFEENYIDGEFVGYGDIVAAEFINQGEKFSAIRYDDGHYYTPEGRSLRKSFLRAPVNFKYISSNFNPKRFHPVQKRYKPHNGIDYRAAIGTPVVAAGDGKVIKAGYNRFNGNYVFIQHGEKYVTKYLHFSKRVAKLGQKVKQGQVIGYVGMTGMATGPHLHYEFLVNGVHRNPRTVKLPKAKPIAKSERAKFMKIASHYMEQLQNNKRIMLAMN